MIKQFKFYLFFVFSALYLGMGNGVAQVTANFEAVDSTGCVTFVASFTDLSTGNLTYRLWNFGNGVTSNSNNINPSTIYTTPGVYDVSLTVSNGIDTATLVKYGYITVLAPPVASYTYQNPVSGCAPLQFHVYDNSTFTNAPIVNWQWDFDDGSAFSTGLNITHNYTNAGDYSVTLIVTDTMGCTDNVVIPNLVHVDPQPNANFFSTDPLSACGAPLTVNITNTSSGTTPLTYDWLVGGVSYTTANVSATFPVAGGFDAQLIAENTFGCSDTLTIPNYVMIGSIQASMQLPDTVCLNESTPIYNTSFGGNTFTWGFGDGNNGVGDTVYHVYTSPGTYTVTLIASSGANCIDTVTQTVVVETIQAAFTSSPNFGCESPLVVNFTDQSTSSGTVVAWQWNFGLNSTACGTCVSDTSTLQNPNNEYYAAGVYDDTLTVISANGCVSTVVVPANDTLLITQADFITNVTEGCAPLLVDFTNITLPFARVDSVFWDYGDGSPIDTTFSPSHTFMNVGIYSVNLTVVSTGGCTTNYAVDITVGTQQNANFAIDTNSICGSDSVQFLNMSTDTSLIDDYLWSFGDGLSSNGDTVFHQYIDTGYFSVSLVVSYNGCPDTLVIDSIVHVNGPIASFTTVMSCDTQNFVQFVPESLGGTNFYWNFGDSTFLDTTNWYTSHMYAAMDSNYNASLIVIDSVSGCSDTVENGVHVRYLEGDLIASDTTPCFGDFVTFSTGNSINALGVVDWALNSTTNFTADYSSVNMAMTQPGANTVYAVVTDEHGCYDTVQQSLFVYRPNVSFSGTPVVGCSPLVVQFTDNSTSDTNIVGWNWDFGDGASSTLQHPSHTYTTNLTSTFDVNLTVTDTFGCVADFTNANYITAIKPPSHFNAINNLLCENDTVRFFGAPSGNYTYLWDFGDGSTSTAYQTQHVYSAGLFSVSLTVTDSNGCSSTFTRNQLVDAQAFPVANFTANPTTTLCYPAMVTFTDSSIVQNPSFWVWNFGDSPNNVILNSNTGNNVYNQPGYYDVTMIVTSSYGCSDTIVKTNFIHIGGPSASIITNPQFGCVGEDMNFDVTNVNTDAHVFTWDYSDGVVDTTYAGNTATSHSFGATGFYPVVLLYSDSAGNCQKVDTITVEVDHVIANATISDSAGCTPVIFGAFNTSTGGNAQQWLLDGVPYAQTNSSNIMISAPGFHDITLISFDNRTMCNDSITHQVEVFPLPNVEATPDRVLCIGDTIRLKVTGANTYLWSPYAFLSDSSSNRPFCYPNQSTQFVVTGTDLNLCVNTDTVDITVQQEPELLLFPSDTFMFVGEEFAIQTASSMNMLYSWTPAGSLSCSNCENPIASPSQPTYYQLVYQDVNGCFRLDTTFFINVMDEFSVFIPNSFTPNGDGDNDTFYPVTYGVEELVYMRIYNRWGQMVYETTDLNQGWDGTFDGEIAAHNTVFSYIISVKRYNGIIKNYMGMVVLISR